jgi:2-oxoglutarate ferredoxin oxidoreductase subunit beta
MPALAAASGAVYVARWTTAQVHQMQRSIGEALQKKGFSFVEIISPCPTYYGRMNRQPTGLDQMRYYRSNSVVRHGANPNEVGIGISGQIITGKFIDVERPYLPGPRDEDNGE